ncbi:uncharacterized protein [Palaemon carinicauda]|uniref:uncharacterized protein n=1 Tax=Palaemon carinicauda TaxID=392227 RepID=UPI0035B5FFB2
MVNADPKRRHCPKVLTNYMVFNDTKLKYRREFISNGFSMVISFQGEFDCLKPELDFCNLEKIVCKVLENIPTPPPTPTPPQTPQPTFHSSPTPTPPPCPTRILWSTFHTSTPTPPPPSPQTLRPTFHSSLTFASPPPLLPTPLPTFHLSLTPTRPPPLLQAQWSIFHLSPAPTHPLTSSPSFLSSPTPTSTPPLHPPMPWLTFHPSLTPTPTLLAHHPTPQPTFHLPLTPTPTRRPIPARRLKTTRPPFHSSPFVFPDVFRNSRPTTSALDDVVGPWRGGCYFQLPLSTIEQRVLLREPVPLHGSGHYSTF